MLLSKFDEWKNLLNDGTDLTFRLAGAKERIITDSHVVQHGIDSISQQTSSLPSVRCLITGELDTPVLLHKYIEGVKGTDKNQAPLISFNDDAYCSFGKRERRPNVKCSYAKKAAANAPIGEKGAFAYTTALNTMLAKDSKNRLQVGDVSTVAWAEKATDFEGWFVSALGESPKDNPDAGVSAVHAIYKSIENGAFQTDTTDGKPPRFYVLGLSPGTKKRISIRFWVVDTVEEIAKRIKRHFDDLCIDIPPGQLKYLDLKQLLISTAVQGKSDNIPPNLGGDTMRSILEGLPYPATLLNAAIHRLRVQRDGKKYRTQLTFVCNVVYPCTAIIKAYLNRF